MAQRIGKYRILERIGRGGMGTVYKAHDTVLDRMVALKVISSEIDVSEDLKARFYREARACAQLNHPNIVIVHDLGEEDGRLFIVMELLEGRELKTLIAERKAVPLEDKLTLMAEVRASRDLDPASPEVQALAARWDQLFERTAGYYREYPELWQAIGKNYQAGAYANQEGAPQAEDFAFIQRVKAARQG